MKKHFAAAAHCPAEDVITIISDVTITRASTIARAAAAAAALLDKEHNSVGIKHTRRNAVGLVTAKQPGGRAHNMGDMSVHGCSIGQRTNS